MSKYKVGDVVKLRDDLEVRNYNGDYYCNYIMTTFKGQKATIARVSNTEPYYTIEEDYRAHNWTEDMIEGLWGGCKPLEYEPYEPKSNKLRLIDILNKIAKGELKEGTKVIFEDIELNFKNGDLEDEDGYSIACIMNNLKDLLSEVELIEPPCEHEWSKYSIGRLGRTENYRRCKKCGLNEEIVELEPPKIEELKQLDMDFAEIDFQSHEEYARCAIQVLARHMIKQIDKLNEVIRKVNKE